MDGATAAVCLVALLAACAAIAEFVRRKRRERLMAKYRDAAVVDAIMAKRIWQGMSREQLLDSWGRPADIGRRVGKMKTVETCKYNQTGRNRYRSRVTVENGIVVGWEQR